MRVSIATRGVRAALLAAVLVALAPATSAAQSGRSAAQSSAPAARSSPPPAATTPPPAPTTPALTHLGRSLSTSLRKAGRQNGAYVVDLTTGQSLYAIAPDVPRLPASVEKLYTTATALLRFGPTATLTTSLFGVGSRGQDGTWNGTLYLRGGGDPTFGSRAFDSYYYGTGATIQRLVSRFVHTWGITGINGEIVGDETYLDSLRGTPATGYHFDSELEGALSALAFNTGMTIYGNQIPRPAVYAAGQLATALRHLHVRVPRSTKITRGATPAGAQLLMSVTSPPMATLVALTNAPSDNFFAEMLLKDIGAQFGGAGTTAAGAAVVTAQMASSFGIYPTLDDGSGLSRDDFTTPRQIVTLLTGEASDPYFTGSLAVAGETGTLRDEMTGTPAQNNCRGKTGTLHDVANLVGYCTAADGHTLAFAFLMNRLGDAAYGHLLEARMAVALATYNG